MRKTLKKLIGMLLTIILVMNVFLEKVPVDAAEISDSGYNITIYTNDDSNKAFKLHVPRFQVKYREWAFIGVEMNQGYEFLDVYDKNTGEKYSFNRESNNIVTINFFITYCFT